MLIFHSRNRRDLARSHAVAFPMKILTHLEMRQAGQSAPAISGALEILERLWPQICDIYSQSLMS